MRISILTIHSICNSGSAWQSYALCEYLNRTGYDTELIDYRPDYSFCVIRRLRNLAVKLLFAAHYQQRAKRFEEFQKRHMKLTTKCYQTYADLVKNPPGADVYMVGSDQIWNTYFPCGNDPAFFLDFVTSPWKLSYAASLGRDDYPISELYTLKEKLSRFRHISVREASGKKQLESVGLQQVQDVVDPVFLLAPQDYERLLQPVWHQKYLLVYAVHNDSMISEVSQCLANELGLKILFLGDFAIRCTCDVSDKSSGPLEFMSYIKYANFILTNSFHCTAFALIFKKNFAVVLPKVNSSRITNLLHLTGLSERILARGENPNKALQPVNFLNAMTELHTHVDASRKWLFDALEDFNLNG